MPNQKVLAITSNVHLNNYEPGPWDFQILVQPIFFNCPQNKVVRWPLLPSYYNQWWVVLGTEKNYTYQWQEQSALIKWSKILRFVSLKIYFLFYKTSQPSSAQKVLSHVMHFSRPTGPRLFLFNGASIKVGKLQTDWKLKVSFYYFKKA